MRNRLIAGLWLEVYPDECQVTVARDDDIPVKVYHYVGLPTVVRLVRAMYALATAGTWAVRPMKNGWSAFPLEDRAPDAPLFAEVAEAERR
jgi:hypothetical protein